MAFAPIPIEAFIEALEPCPPACRHFRSIDRPIFRAVYLFGAFIQFWRQTTIDRLVALQPNQAHCIARCVIGCGRRALDLLYAMCDKSNSDVIVQDRSAPSCRRRAHRSVCVCRLCVRACVRACVRLGACAMVVGV